MNQRKTPDTTSAKTNTPSPSKAKGQLQQTSCAFQVGLGCVLHRRSWMPAQKFIPRIPKMTNRNTVIDSTEPSRGMEAKTVLTKTFKSGRVVMDRNGRITRKTRSILITLPAFPSPAFNRFSKTKVRIPVKTTIKSSQFQASLRWRRVGVVLLLLMSVLQSMNSQQHEDCSCLAGGAI